MTVNEVFGLRNQGRKEEAYEAARLIYATDKSPYAATAMFWTAVDILRVRVSQERLEEAGKICEALERLTANQKDERGWMRDALAKCHHLLEGSEAAAAATAHKPEHLLTGQWGEELAAAYLRDKGYVILERDWRSKHRDIDIIARQDQWIVFVEVKTRSNDDIADPLQAVGYKKRENLILAINHYIRYRKVDAPWRLDVITVVGKPGDGVPEIRHIEDFPLT